MLLNAILKPVGCHSILRREPAWSNLKVFVPRLFSFSMDNGLNQSKRRCGKAKSEATVVIWAIVLLAWPDYYGKGKKQTDFMYNQIKCGNHWIIRYRKESATKDIKNNAQKWGYILMETGKHWRKNKWGGKEMKRIITFKTLDIFWDSWELPKWRC